MKKITTVALTALTLLCTVQLNAQSLVVSEMDSVLEVNSSAVADYGFSIDVENVSGVDVDVYAKRAYSTANCAYDSGYFCWDFCYSSDVDNSIGSVQILAGTTRTDFSGHVYSPNTGANCIDSTRYVFFDGKNPSDSLSVWVTISAGPTIGTVELAVSADNVYPNPAKDKITVNAAKVGTFRLYNALGSLVRAEQLQRGNNVLDVSGLSNGVYLYSVDDMSFKRLIVKH